ncbi:MAG TPA: SLC26A/SulP transporter family protein [Rhodospirillaceae bacterium]|nr:SLC26A/SulP transporter family protein [Rhodospirillaceae bacterium]
MLVALPSAIAFGVTIFSPLGAEQGAKGALAGIVGATVLGLCASVIGSSRCLITAPCAPAAAMLSALAISLAGQAGIAETVLLLAIIGLFAGLFQVGLGLARIGKLIKFIPYPVVSGYLSGVGLIIIGSQIPKILGVPTGTGVFEALTSPAGWRWQTVLVGGIVMAVMLLLPRLTRSVPAAILGLMSGIVTYLALGWSNPDLLHSEHNPLLVGAITGADGNIGEVIVNNFRAFSAIELGYIVKILVPAVTLAALLSIDTLKTCVVLDALTNSHHDPNRQLIGQGIGNVVSALFGGIPGAGTMGASLVNSSSGGTTRVSGFMSGAFCFAAFLVLSPLIAWVPVSALAGILIVVGFRMIDRHSLMFFYSPATRLDFLVIVSVIIVALFVNLIAASGVGVAFAILLFIREQTRSTVVRHKIEGHKIHSKRTKVAVDLGQIDGEGCDTVIFELQGSLFFGTASQLHAALEPETETRKYVILSMRRVQSLDLTATHVLEQIKDRLEENDAYLVFCDIPKGLPSGLKMKRFLKETGVVRPTNKAFAFRQLEDALEWVEQHRLESDDQGEDKKACSLELRDMPAFEGLSDAALVDLGNSTTMQSVKAGKKLFKAGTESNELFLIRSGTVRLNLPIHKKDHYHLATCGPGDFFGGRGFVDPSVHTVDALAVSDVEVFVLRRTEFLGLSERHPTLAFKIIETIAHNLSDRLRAAVDEIHALRS